MRRLTMLRHSDVRGAGIEYIHFRKNKCLRDGNWTINFSSRRGLIMQDGVRWETMMRAAREEKGKRQPFTQKVPGERGREMK